MATKIVQDASLTAVADAIREKGETEALLEFPDDFVSAIEAIQSGGTGGITQDAEGYLVLDSEAGEETEEEPLKDVVFIDYDGTIKYQYTKSDFLALTRLPANPSHEGLTAQGWNWTLADAQEYVAEYDYLCIGQSYVTDDGKTRIYLTIDDVSVNIQYELRIYVSVKNGATVNWGDGSSPMVIPTVGTVNYCRHTYTEKGDYIITIEVTEGNVSLGYNGANGTFFGQGDLYKIASTRIKKIELGSNVNAIFRQAFLYATNIESISIPIGVSFSSGGNSTQFTNIKMKGLVIPKGCTAVGPLGSLFGLELISLPKELTTVHASPMFNSNTLGNLRMFTFASFATESKIVILQLNGRKLEKFRVTGSYTTIFGDMFTNNGGAINNFDVDILIPSQVTQIDDYAFTGTNPLQHFHLRPTTPPTLANVRAFNQRIAGYTKFYVPYSEDHSILEAYQTATNWSTFANMIVEEPQ